LGWQGGGDILAHDLKAKCKKKSGDAKKKCLKKAKKHAAELPPVTCGAGTKICNGQCIPSASCCGGCPAGTICQDGFCVLCASGETPCRNACVNLATDAANCGRCGRTCPSGECLNGACTCGVAECPSGCNCNAAATGGGACGGTSGAVPCRGAAGSCVSIKDRACAPQR
jgi:hypothetical protein